MNESELMSCLKKVIERHIGRDSAITAGAMSEMFGYQDDRPIRLAIEKLIDDDFPVCSVTEEPAGYFFPSGVEEAKTYTVSRRRRALRIFHRRRHIIRNTARYYEKAEQGVL